MTNTRPVAQSLHTVTVIVQVARVYIKGFYTVDQALELSLETLGLAGRPDPYGLAAQARKQLMVGKVG
jgi:hypothetical protein